MNPCIRIGLMVVSILGMVGCQSTRQTETARTEQLTDPVSEQGQSAASAQPTQAWPATIAPVYFDLDRWELKTDARELLKANAKQIQAHPEETVLIEGHCDERGSDEYNLALGERRAGAVKQFLEDLGVAPSRLETVSYGETQPAVQGRDEDAWRLNRRSEIRLGSRQASR